MSIGKTMKSQAKQMNCFQYTKVNLKVLIGPRPRVT